MIEQEPPKSTLVRWAFLVGINNYIDPNFASLKFCINDVTVLEKTLKDLNYEVICLHDEQTDPRKKPTRDNIEAELIKLCQTIQRDDLLFVHFACHGKLVNQKPVLITYDTRYQLIEKGRALSVAEIENYMKGSKANQLILSLDACHTGVEIGRDVTDPEFLHNVYDLAMGFALIAASTSQQKAQDWQEKKHGVYTYYLLEGLRGEADISNKMVVTVRDLQEYVTDKLRRWAVKEGALIQEPTIRMEGIGDIILADYRQTPKYKPIANPSIANINPTITHRDGDVLALDIDDQITLPSAQLSIDHIPTLSIFNFEYVTVNAQGKIINRQRGQAKYFTENLLEGINIDMVFIPDGSFIMGSSDTTKPNENPPHEVMIQSFFLGKYPVTQAQWRVVASFPEVNCKLDVNPSFFKGDSRPVENVNWYEVYEFCQRLGIYTGHKYRLPSEAEWEYACRSNSNTPFYFGETLTRELANYLDSKDYETTQRGKYVNQTRPVMSFPPNAFGLYDMHGNVREWCYDHWHENYQGTPLDGKAWVIGGKDSHKILRGGSHSSRIEDCRSTSRQKDLMEQKNYLTGFRIACFCD